MGERIYTPLEEGLNPWEEGYNPWEEGYTQTVDTHLWGKDAKNLEIFTGRIQTIIHLKEIKDSKNKIQSTKKFTNFDFK